MTTYYTTLDSPLGALMLVSAGAALTGLYLPPIEPDAAWVRDDEALPFPEARRQVAAYFAGERPAFDLPLAPAGSAFQQRVWAALRDIPYGETRSYQAIATQLGQPGAARAVGLANGRNPIAIIVPCHRVVGSSGTLVGYRGGLSRKAALLALEGGPAGATQLTLDAATLAQ